DNPGPRPELFSPQFFCPQELAHSASGAADDRGCIAHRNRVKADIHGGHPLQLSPISVKRQARKSRGLFHGLKANRRGVTATRNLRLFLFSLVYLTKQTPSPTSAP